MQLMKQQEHKDKQVIPIIDGTPKLPAAITAPEKPILPQRTDEQPAAAPQATEVNIKLSGMTGEQIPAISIGQGGKQ